MSDLSFKMAARRFTAHEVYKYSGRWKKAAKKTCIERKGMPSLAQPTSTVVTVTIQTKVLRR